MEIASLPAKTTAGYDSFFWGGAMIGRFVRALLLRRFKPTWLLVGFTSAAAALVTTSMILGDHAANRYMLLAAFCWLPRTAQNCSFRASWIERGPPI